MENCVKNINFFKYDLKNREKSFCLKNAVRKIRDY